MKILFHLIEISAINSYIIYQTLCSEAKQKSIQLEYRKSIIRDLAPSLRDKLSIPSSKNKTIKRKRSDDLKFEFFYQCQLELIPPLENRKSTKVYCKMHDDTNTNPNTRGPQTSYWRKNCKNICVLIYHDKHRNSSQYKNTDLSVE